MIQPQATGIFGKLPAHGDFIHRNLSTTLINNWDTWLQTFIGSTQERLGDGWLDIYLTSPIWRFCLSSGVVDESPWAGILLPSVDRVGRYFPLSIMRKLPDSIVPTEFICTEEGWFQEIEASALQALDGQIQVDQLVVAINQCAPNERTGYSKQRALPVAAGVVVDTHFEEPSTVEVTAPATNTTLRTMPHHLDAFVSTVFSSYSVWATSGSERVEPCSFICAGLPPVAGSAAMMDGMWEQWEWSVPVFLDGRTIAPGVLNNFDSNTSNFESGGEESATADASPLQYFAQEQHDEPPLDGFVGEGFGESEDSLVEGVIGEDFATDNFISNEFTEDSFTKDSSTKDNFAKSDFMSNDFAKTQLDDLVIQDTGFDLTDYELPENELPEKKTPEPIPNDETQKLKPKR